MLLITGGAFQGKLNYTLELTGLGTEDIVDCEYCEYDEVFTGKILYNFQEFIKKLLTTEEDVSKHINKLVRENPDAIVIINEVGSGIIPLKKEERTFRETVGRMACFLAKEAKEVHRVICGLGVRIDETDN